MKRLQNKANVDAPSVDYPYGKQRDKLGGTPGTRWDFEQANDVFQTMEKIFAESGLVANGLPDNATNGFQLREALNIAILGHKRYTAIINQQGTAAPTATAIGPNEIGAIVWTRTAVGDYTGTLTGAFPSGKTLVFVQQDSFAGNVPPGFIQAGRGNGDTVRIRTYNSAGALSDGILSTNLIGSSLEIRAYY